ncbi:hypothetical protein BN988_02857 [Oceanobacillus picturae]|uniref:Uncharacterized protein n=1 Tax=Oceanobacillus picturae TaxID=171693 RepID=W9AFP4_9BACI|nr:hypothetical protein [Oceanobacillus picturae]CDO04303.1 hypothetical protein BN988_02857 [Oceanobacillus picturae]
MSLAVQEFQKQDSESKRAIDKYYESHKEELLKYPNLVPTFDFKTKKVYCVYKPRSVDNLLKMMINLRKEEVDRNLKKFGYWERRHYVYRQLNLKESKKSKKVCSSKQSNPRINEFTELAKFFSFAFDVNAGVFVHLLNKETGDTYYQPTESLKDSIKLSTILQSPRFNRNIDLMYSLSTFKTMKSATDENVYSIPLIQIDVDYRKIKQYKKMTPQQVWQIILEEEVGKTIPHPSAIEYGHQLRLLYKIKDLYIKKGSEASKNIARRISKVFANRLSEYGAEYQPITSHGRILGSINSKDGSTIKMKVFGHDFTIEGIKEEWLDPLPSWYLEWKSKQKKKGKIIHLHNTLTLNKKRLRDFFRIVDYFDGDLDGRRFLCFMVRSHALLAGYSPDEAKDMMFELNERFKTPLKKSSIDQDTRNVERKQYAPKNQTILEHLSIPPQMEEKLQLQTIISAGEKKRRNRVKKASQYREEVYGNLHISKRILIEEEKQKIINLLSQGVVKKDICIRLSIQPKTLQRRIRELKKEGRL